MLFSAATECQKHGKSLFISSFTVSLGTNKTINAALLLNIWQDSNGRWDRVGVPSETSIQKFEQIVWIRSNCSWATLHSSNCSQKHIWRFSLDGSTGCTKWFQTHQVATEEPKIWLYKIKLSEESFVSSKGSYRGSVRTFLDDFVHLHCCCELQNKKVRILKWSSKARENSSDAF